MSKYELSTYFRDLFLDSDYIKGRKKSKKETWKFIVDYKLDDVRKQQRINTHKSNKSEAKAVRDEILSILEKEPHRIGEFAYKKKVSIQEQETNSSDVVVPESQVLESRYRLDMLLHEAFEAYRKRRESDVTIERRTVKSINDIFMRHVIMYFKHAHTDLRVKDIVLDHFISYFNIQITKGIGEFVVDESDKKIKPYKPLISVTVKKHCVNIGTALDEIIS